MRQHPPTPRHGHAPITMRRVAGYDEAKALGDFYWSTGPDGTRYLHVALPGWPGKGNPLVISLPLRPTNVQGASWGWDGNEDQPTLTPSVHTLGHWHGWIRAGQLVEA